MSIYCSWKTIHYICLKLNYELLNTWGIKVLFGELFYKVLKLTHLRESIKYLYYNSNVVQTLCEEFNGSVCFRSLLGVT